MADVELRGVSLSYEALCRAVAASEQVCALIDGLPTGKRQPNLLLGSVRYLGGPVDEPAAFLDFVTSQWDVLEPTILTHRTQTNEPGRCATLLPLLASLPQPLALLEVGASAGLCLYPDRYSYRYATIAGEHRLGDSGVVLSCTVTGAAPLPDHLPEVVWRAGLDLNPLNAAEAQDRAWLASLIWPEHLDVPNDSATRWTSPAPTRRTYEPVTQCVIYRRWSPKRRPTSRWSPSTRRYLPT